MVPVLAVAGDRGGMARRPAGTPDLVIPPRPSIWSRPAAPGHDGISPVIPSANGQVVGIRDCRLDGLYVGISVPVEDRREHLVPQRLPPSPTSSSWVHIIGLDLNPQVCVPSRIRSPVVASYCRAYSGRPTHCARRTLL
jgi:hypothetical protein